MICMSIYNVCVCVFVFNICFLNLDVIRDVHLAVMEMSARANANVRMEVVAIL